jgi:hypothetical protein
VDLFHAIYSLCLEDEGRQLLRSVVNLLPFDTELCRRRLKPPHSDSLLDFLTVPQVTEKGVCCAENNTRFTYTIPCLLHLNLPQEKTLFSALVSVVYSICVLMYNFCFVKTDSFYLST